MGFAKLLTSFVLILLFTIAVVSYMSGFADDNKVYVSIDNDSDMSSLRTTAKTQIQVFSGDVNGSSESFSKSTIASGDENIESGGVFKNPFTFFSGIKSVLRVGYKKIFGSDDNFGIALTAFVSILTIAIMAAVWSAWKGGNPE